MVDQGVHPLLGVEPSGGNRLTWWYVSSDIATCLVEEQDGVITDAAPIYGKFIGQPAKSLGDWLRSKGEVEFHRIEEAEPMTHTYSWGNNPKRALLKGRPCRVVARGARRSVLIEFDDGRREVVSYRSLREIHVA